MIRELFIPEKVGTYYIGSHQILALDIRDHSIFSIDILAHQKQVSIQRCIDKKIDAGMQETKSNRTASAIETITEQLASPPEIVSTLSSSIAVIKTVTLPFTSYEQIEGVLAYEIEPALPFPLKNAALDFIVTHVDTELNQSDVLVVAVQKYHILEHLELFSQKGMYPRRITIDAIALYNTYQRIPGYKNLQGGVVLLDIDTNETRVLYIRDGRLRLVRNVPHGLTHNNDNNSLSSFWNNIAFTIKSFSAHNNKDSGINTVLLLGTAAAIPGIEEFASRKLQIPCELFKIKDILYNQSITTTQQPCLNILYATALGAALGSTATRPFNLLSGELKKEKKELVYVYLLTALGLTTALLGGLLLFSWFYNKSWHNEIHGSSIEAIKKLQNRFGEEQIKLNPNRPVARQLSSAVDDAKRIVKKRKDLWSAFSGPSRASFLTTLYNLFSSLDAQALGLKLSKLKLKNDILTLKGEVKNFDALTAFDSFLDDSKFFGPITRGTLQDTSFDIDIEVITPEAE